MSRRFGVTGVLALDFDDASLRGDDNGLSPIVDAQAAQNNIHVPLHSAVSNAERLRNFVIGKSLYDQAKYVDFTRA